MTITDTTGCADKIEASLGASGDLIIKVLADELKSPAHEVELKLQRSGKRLIIDGERWYAIQNDGIEELIIHAALETGDINESYIDWSSLATFGNHSSQAFKTIIGDKKPVEQLSIRFNNAETVQIRTYALTDPKGCEYIAISADLNNDEVLFDHILARDTLSGHMLNIDTFELESVAGPDALALGFLLVAHQASEPAYPELCSAARQFDIRKLVALANDHGYGKAFSLILENQRLKEKVARGSGNTADAPGL